MSRMTLPIAPMGVVSVFASARHATTESTNDIAIAMIPAHQWMWNAST
jgi:hypothetical protein